MDIAQTKRRENIAEYILYLWQLEDLLRALQFSPEAVWSQLVAPRGLDEQTKQACFVWYMEIANLLREEGKESKGHLAHTLHLIADLHDLHTQLLRLPAGEHYRATFAKLEGALPQLREVAEGVDGAASDTELCFRALYGAMLYRIKGQGDRSAVNDTVELISPVIGELAAMYGRIERGEIDLYKDEN